MPRNGNGEYILPAGNPVIPGTVIEAEWANNTMNDLAAALTDSLTADGQTTPISNLPMGGFHHTGVSDPTLRNQYATLGMSQDGKNTRVQITGGVDNLTGVLVGNATAYYAGAILSFFAPAANTGPMTLSYNGIPAASIVTNQGLPLQASDLGAGKNYLVQYTGTVFQLLTPVASQAGTVYTQAAVTGWIRPESGVYPPLTLGSGTSVNIPAGQGVIVPPGADGANDAFPVVWSAQSVTLSYLTTSCSTAIAIDGTGAVTQFAGRMTAAQERDYILLGMVVHVNGVATSVQTTPAIFGDNGYLNIDTATILSNVLVAGGETTPNGANLLLNVANGTIAVPGGNFSSIDSPNTIPLVGGNGISFWRIAGQNTIGAQTNSAPVGFYDPAGSGTVTAIPGNGDTVIHRLYYLFGSFIWVYGQQYYTNISTALNYLEVDRSQFIPPLRLNDATLIAEIIASKGTTSLQAATAEIITYGGANFSIGNAGGIGEAPVDGKTYGRRNATWSEAVSSNTPNFTGDVVITKSGPKVIEVFDPVAAGYAGLNVKQLGFNWCNVEATHPDDKTYFRSYNPANGNLRNTTTWDLATGDWDFPGDVTALTFNGAALPVFGTAASANVTTSATDTTPGRVWRTNDLVKTTSATDTTAGSMLKVGDFGLGTLGNIPNTGNMDAMLPTGFYKFVSGVDTGTPPSGANYGVVQSETFATDLSRQTYYAVNSLADSTSIFTRQIRGTTTIGPWTQLITGSTGLGSFKGASLFTTSTTMTASDAGMLYLFFTGSTLTITLPLYSAVPLGTNIRIFNNSSLPQTIQRQGSNTINWAKDPAATTSISIPAGCFIDIATTIAADAWVVVADNVALGYGQSWTDVTASRALSTTYTNSTPRPIQVMVGGSGTPTNIVVPTVAGLALPTHQASATGSNQRMVCSFIVPTGATYSVAMSAGSLLTWSELR